MIDLIKKSVLAGLGLAVVTKEKVEEALGDFVREGKLNASDAKIMAEKIAEQGRKEFDEIGEKLAARLREFTAKAEESAEKRISALEQRVRVLEQNAAPPPSRAREP
jgi:polyhydroxyalkanoate synthesis regulator phasin